MNAPRLTLTGARLMLLPSLVSALTIALVTGCSSSDGYSRSTVSTGSSFYYGSPYPYYGYPYYGYDGPDYIVSPPPRPDYPGGELPVRPEQPIAYPPGSERPSTLPAERPGMNDRPGTRPAPSTSDRSRMPSAQPRMSSPSRRPSIPSRSRGGGGRRGR